MSFVEIIGKRMLIINPLKLGELGILGMFVRNYLKEYTSLYLL